MKEDKNVTHVDFKKKTSDGDQVELVDNSTEEFPDVTEAIEVKEAPVAEIREEVKGTLLMYQKGQETFYGIQTELNELYINFERSKESPYLEKFDHEGNPTDFGGMSVSSMQAKVTESDVLSIKEDDFYGYKLQDKFEMRDFRQVYTPHTVVFYSGSVDSIRANVYYLDATNGLLTYPISNKDGAQDDKEYINKFIDHMLSGKGTTNFTTIMLPGTDASVIVKHNGGNIYVNKNISKFSAIDLADDEDVTDNIFNILQEGKDKSISRNIAYVTQRYVYFNGYKLVKMPKIFMALGIEDPKKAKMMDIQKINTIIEALVLDPPPSDIVPLFK